MQKLQSGISGEIMPLRSLGYALDEATLKQVAYNHGITESLTNMSQAQKSQIRYLAIMEQSKNALGDMARTIESPANQLRIFSQRVDQLKRAIGNGLMPIISAALPYVTALVRMLTEGAQKIADFLGFEIPVFDYGDLIAAQNADISSSFDEATSAAREFQGSLSSIDQLNIIGDKAKSSAADGLGGLYDLNIDLPSYDFLGGLSEQADDAYNKLKNIVNEALPWVEALAGAFIGFKIGQGIFKIPIAIAQVTTALSKLPPWITKVFSKLAPLGIAVGAAVSSFVLLKSSVKGLMTDTGSLTGNLLKLGAGVGIATAAIAGLALTGHPALAVIVGITAALGAAIGAIQATVEEMKAFDDELNNSITYAENGGISLTGLTDGFKDYVKAITDHYDDILTNTSAFKENQEKINGAVGEVKNLVDKYTLLGQTMTSEDAQSIADNVKIIGDGISENLGVGTQGIVDTLKNHFHEFALQLGADVDDMVTKFYLLEGMGNTALAATRKKADEIAVKLQTGDLSADEQRQALEELQNTVKAMGTTDIGTQEEMNFARALQEMANTKINFEDPTKAMDNINSLNEAAQAARASITTAYEDQSYQLAQMKRQYETMIDLSSGMTVKELFDTNFGTGTFDTLFSQTQEIYDRAKETNLARVDTGVVAYISMLQSQLDANSNRYANTKIGEVGPGMGSGITAFFTRGGLFMKKDAMYKQAMEDYEAEYENLNSELYTALDSALNGLNVTPEAIEAGRQIMSGAALGALQSVDDVTKVLNTAAESMIKGFNDTLEIKSPSRVFARSGGYIMKGLANGITDGQRYALRAIDETARAMQRQMSDFYFEVPEYTSEDFEKIMLGDFSIAPSSLPTPPTTESYDERTVSEMASIFAAAKQNGEPIVLHNYTTVELDGQVLGEAQSTYQNDQMVYSNGVTR